MPRNASGNYSLPLPPVVPDTIIESDWANDTLDDLAQAITDSLDRFGRGNMAGPFRSVDGTVGAPGLSWVGETNTGFFRPSAGVMSVSVLGNKVSEWGTAGFGVGYDAPVNAIEIGIGRAADGIAYLDFTSVVGADFNLRLIRGSGVDGASTLIHKGVGNLSFIAEDDAALVLGTDNTQRIIITPDGRFYGTALHNNAGSLLGTANQYIASGTYVPGIFDVLNIAAISGVAGRWIRVGNVVTVSVTALLTTAGAAFSQALVPIPINGTNAGAYLSGVAVLNPPGSIFSGTVISNGAGALLSFVASAAAAHDMNMVFTYVIL